MNLTFISTGEYPDTHAAAIRQSTIAKGLVEQGHVVNFLLLTPQNWDGKTTLDYHGVQFQQLNNFTGKNKIIKHFHYIKAISKAKKLIKIQSENNKIDALVIYAFWTKHLLPMYYMIKSILRYKINVYLELTELPYVYEYKNKWLTFYENHFLTKFTGIFVISNKLELYIQQFNKHTQKILSVVDVSFFSSKKPSLYKFPYIGYCGTIRGKKDGVPILIEAFAQITTHLPEVKLVLVGNSSNKEHIKETLIAIKKFNIEEKVIFTGLIDRNLMPVILGNAEILVVSKPDNEQNSGNFPIKIGEYLATGVPVVLTIVGEIPLFIEDGKNGYLAAAGNPVSFAKKMEEALSNPVKSKLIGLEGKKIACEMFDYKIQSKVMADYIIKQSNNNVQLNHQ